MSSYAEGQTHQLVNALEAASFTANHLTKLGQFHNLNGVKKLLDGLAKIKIVKHLIDCDAPPSRRKIWKVEDHRKGGQLIWDPTKVKLYLSPKQVEDMSIQGHELRGELVSQPVLNANVLDYLLANQQLIPLEWKRDEQGRPHFIYFWGTIYSDFEDELIVRLMHFMGGRWRSDYDWLDSSMGVVCPSAVSTK